MEKGNTKHGLLVTIAGHKEFTDEEYNIYKAQAVQLQGDGDIKYLYSDDALDGLTLRGQQSTTFPGVWTNDPYFDAHSVDLAKARAYVATLTKIERYMERERQTRGNAQDYAENLVRVALALGIKTVVEHTPGNPNGYNYRFYTLGDAVYWLRWEAQQWAEKHAKVETA